MLNQKIDYKNLELILYSEANLTANPVNFLANSGYQEIKSDFCDINFNPPNIKYQNDNYLKFVDPAVSNDVIWKFDGLIFCEIDATVNFTQTTRQMSNICVITFNANHNQFQLSPVDPLSIATTVFQQSITNNSLIRHHNGEQPISTNFFGYVKKTDTHLFSILISSDPNSQTAANFQGDNSIKIWFVKSFNPKFKGIRPF